VIRAAPIAAICALLAFGGGISQAAFPGKAGPIAYSSVFTSEVAEGEVKSSGGLFIPARAKDPPIHLTSEPGDHSPSYSPNGRLIVFVNDDEDGRGDLFAIANDGSGRRQLTSGPEEDSDPSFFPDGQRIVFSRAVGSDHHLYSIRLDGNGLQALTSGHADDLDPVVSPNGRRIAFVSNRDEDERGDRADIFSMRPDGSGLRVLIDGTLYDHDPDYAPSGRRIAFVSNVGPGTANVFLARSDGRRVRQLTPCRPFPARCRSHSKPAFSPDGRHIVMLGSGGRGGDIEVWRTDGRGGVRTLDSSAVEEEGFGSTLGPPAWGPRPR
jgi:TolB protein